jgi:hypothetical protein
MRRKPTIKQMEAWRIRQAQLKRSELGEYVANLI